MSTHELYSCTRCRRLKKKCSKDAPTCSSCAKVNESCEYPGRAPRRTKKEIEAALLRGELPQNKKRKKIEPDEFSPKAQSPISLTSTSPDSGLIGDLNSTISVASTSGISGATSLVGSDNAGNIHINNNTRDSLSNILNNERVKAEGFPSMSTSASASPQSANINGKTTTIHLEGVSSLISVLSSLNNNSNGNQNMNQNNNININQTPINNNNNISNPIGETPETKLPVQGLLSQLPRTPGFANAAFLNLKDTPISKSPSNINSLEQLDASKLNLFQENAVPIVNSAIQSEAISVAFKGGEKPDWEDDVADSPLQKLDKSLYDKFIAAYFQHNHRTFPMIDKRAFLGTVSTVRDFNDMSEFDDTFAFKLNMIMAIGCTTLHRAGLLKKEHDFREHFAFVAMSKFSKVLRLQNMETIKCLLLLGIYSFFEPRGVSSWTISGLTMRLTISLGLNRALPLSKMQKVSAIEVELRSRVFWSAYCYERLVATSLGRISAIEDEEISVPLPHALYEEEKDDIEVTLMTISLRKVSGRIYKLIHSTSAGRQNKPQEEKEQIITSLREEIDEICENEKIKIQQKSRQGKNPTSPEDGLSSETSGDLISFHNSDIWLAMRHAQLQIMLYRPSSLIPKPSPEAISKLGEVCLESLKHTYALYKKKLLPLNWITLFRVLTICNTMLFCLCQWGIDLVESEKEIQQCVEILQHFGENWVFATRCAEVFQNISNRILEISLTNGKVPNMDELTKELFGANNAYQEILDENNVDVSWVDKLL
ncbi:hypothetical protein TBLA_0B07920 [Henningerozyma blattae CBS 6284]|uniref:Zn(2)-C6 fungal-type domain-containing protein n=1 Tax=Henningerozyma blattae (strain ATCC 34711 / CBS 6284 / DSM 70876 / NBRC 10599 / NRRL Y-10934 / UCD 77-7) TaxID=1071380 RepID=I2GZQ6_HENB6|nr:hypothetical protein TBLA_0B07920 [Tetrapisispora blattae CBS 6284]CCH59608.1 hypothetical protein TBLA_0B07920 [Tetrapisispora blattae CBS 6284]